MNRSIRRKAAGLLACLLVLAPLASVVAAVAAVIHYQHESYQAFQNQMASGQIKAVTFNKKPHSVHITLNDGRRMLAIYPPHDEPQLAAALTAKGVPVAIERHKSTVKPVHHTLRYIAGGILVLVILAILAVLLIGRRRNLADGTGGGVGQPGEASAPPPAG
jgi:4-amino-4-deoxy-L-arabinose transferase-like glycosyltransferase